jgi:hypothetical protein
MVVITVELVNAITGARKILGIGQISNTGSGTATVGNYEAIFKFSNGRQWKESRVEGFPRKRLLAWDLLYRALKPLIGERNDVS